MVKVSRPIRASFRKIKQDLCWAVFYNVIMVPLAIKGFMYPVLGKIAIAFSSIDLVTPPIVCRRKTWQAKEPRKPPRLRIHPA